VEILTLTPEVWCPLPGSPTLLDSDENRLLMLPKELSLWDLVRIVSSVGMKFYLFIFGVCAALRFFWDQFPAPSASSL
jgi:hypothetical protein